MVTHIFIEIDTWYIEELFNRDVGLIECQTIEFTMPKFSLEICQYKILLRSYTETYYETSEEKILI